MNSLDNRWRMLNSQKTDKANYVTDGLIFWIDGYDKPKDGIWYDRISRRPGTLTSGIIHNPEKHCYTSTTLDEKAAFTAPTFRFNNFTIEYVFVVRECDIHQGLIIYGYPYYLTWYGKINGGNNALVSWGYQREVYLYTYNQTSKQLFPETMARLSYTHYNYRQTFKCTCDNNSTSIKTADIAITGTSNSDICLFDSPIYDGVGLKGDFYCLRVYNRPLTDLEQLNNLQEDKRRFG